MRASCFSRVFFIIASSQYGLGPESTEVGDKMYILLGSNDPVVLRPVWDYVLSQGSLAKTIILAQNMGG